MKKATLIIFIVLLVSLLSCTFAFGDDSPVETGPSILVDGVKYETTKLEGDNLSVTVPADAKTLSIIRGEDKNYADNEMFPYMIWSPIIGPGIACEAGFIESQGGQTWEEASYDSATKTFNIPIHFIIESCEGNICLSASNFGGYYLYVYVEALPHEHTYGDPSYSWSDDNTTCTATAECTAEDCDSSEGKTVTETVNTTKEVTKEATCAVEGECTYTAKFENELFTEQTKTGPVDKVEHTWNEGEVTKEPSVDEEGVMTYTCTVCGEAKTEAIPKLTAAENASNLIADLPSTITVENKDQIKEARDAYEALSEEEKAAFDEAGLLKLEAAEAKLEAAEAKAEAEQAVKDKEAAEQAAKDAQDKQEAADKAAEEALAKQEAADKEATEAKAKLEEAEKALLEAQEAQKAAEEKAAKAEAEAEKAKIAQKKAEAKNYTVKGLKVTSKNGKFTVKYSKNKNATGYQVQYKLKTAKKYTNLKKATTKLKVTSKKLKKGKVYQFRVRTYTVVNGKKVNGQWTKVKSVKCK